MKIKMGDAHTEHETLLPPDKPDGSGIGVNYADAVLRGLGAQLTDGRKISCKRRGLKVTLFVGDQQGIGLMRRLENGPDEKVILMRALEEAAAGLDSKLVVEDRVWSLEFAG